jgi:hypothetical protein
MGTYVSQPGGNQLIPGVVGLRVNILCVNHECSLSLWRAVRGSKLMRLELIHGLFIT